MNRALLLGFLLVFLPFSGLLSQFVNPLQVPDTLGGTTFNLTVQFGTTQFLPGAATETYGINQSYLGPTLILQRGATVHMNVTNQIPDTTTIHWHGLHVSPENDGGPHTPIAPNTTWSPTFKVLDEASTFWYHPHLHHYTAEQVYLGAAAMIIVRDSHEAALNLPRTYGVDDFPIILQDKSFVENTNALEYVELSDTMMINGTLAPYLEVPAQWVRFRILNASNQRVYNVGFPPNSNAKQIGSDGGLLASPLPITRIQIAPGERAEVVVDFSSTAAQFPLMANNSEMGTGISGAPNGPGGHPGNPLDGNDFPLMEFRVVPATPNAVMSIPPVLRTYQFPNINDVSVTRIKVFDTLTTSFPYLINSTLFDLDVNNDTVMLGATEIWELRNHTNIAHPFHIHDVQFHVIEFNGGPPPGHLAGRKDVILLQPLDTIKFITRFDDFADMHTPYMYHCHNLFHEDGGMMAQFVVMDTMTTATPKPQQKAQGRITAWPNPSPDGQLTLQDQHPAGPALKELEVYDAQGRQVLQQAWNKGLAAQQVDLAGMPQGMYLLRVRASDGQVAVLRVVK